VLVAGGQGHDLHGVEPAGGIERGTRRTTITAQSRAVRELRVGRVAAERAEADGGQHAADRHVHGLARGGPEARPTHEPRKLDVTGAMSDVLICFRSANRVPA